MSETNIYIYYEYIYIYIMHIYIYMNNHSLTIYCLGQHIPMRRSAKFFILI